MVRLRGFYGLKNKKLTDINPRTRKYYHTKYELSEIARNLGLKNFSKYNQKDLAEYIESSDLYRRSSHAKQVGIKSTRKVRTLPELSKDDIFEVGPGYKTIGERIKERAEGLESADWYASELLSELSEYGEKRYPKLGEMCFFSYNAAYPEQYPYYDTRPLVYVLEYQEDKLLGANVHYLNPSYRGAIAGSVINKYGARLPKKTIHSYFFTNMGEVHVLPPASAEYASVAELVTESFVDKYGTYVEPHTVWDSI